VNQDSAVIIVTMV